MNTKSFKQNSSDLKAVKIILSPSWLSGLIAVICGLALTAGVILTISLSGVDIKHEILSLGTTPRQQAALTLPGQQVSAGRSTLQNTWPLMAFWGVVGLIVYRGITLILKLVDDIKEFNEQLNYVNANRHEIIHSAILSFIFSFSVFLVWLYFINYFIKVIMPYCIDASEAAATNLTSSNGIKYSFIALGIVTLSMHLHTIFLRLALRRPRLFSNFYLDV